MSVRDYGLETEKRVEFIRGVLEKSGARGIIFANSGGKDCALTGILCKKACHDTVGLIMPCGSARNYGRDKDDAEGFARLFDISVRYIDLTGVRDRLVAAVGDTARIEGSALANIAPRLRMTTLYAVGASENRLVAGTGNRSEIYMGYFTKWGDGAYDFNPIADLTVTEVYEFLNYLDAPKYVVDKAPSAGLYDGQTDEGEMGVTYGAIDGYLTNGAADARDMAVIGKYHGASGHKRKMPEAYE